MKKMVPQITLNNGICVPQLSIGTYKVDDLQSVIRAGFQAGLDAVDAAEHYHNEAEVGQALAAIGRPRSEYYLSTKIWNLDHGYQRTLEAFEESVRRLQTQPDMLLIHWPCPMKGLYQETWQALQKLYADGRVKAIGVSNFKVHHLEALKALGGVQPMVNQIEMHPYYIDDEMLEYAKKNNMVVEAWSPLMRGKQIITDPVIVNMAEKYGVSPAQLTIRYLTQYGVRVIVKSNNPVHLAENCEIFSFTIEDEDIQTLRKLNRGKRVFQDPDEYYI